VDDAVTAAPPDDAAETTDDATDTSADEATDTTADEASDAVEDSSELTPGPWDGSALPLEDGSAPEGYEIKGNEESKLYHVPEGRYYDQTKAEYYFATVDAAEAAGFSAPAADADVIEAAEEDDE
jgi:large subunit ribosomal protein L17